MGYYLEKLVEANLFIQKTYKPGDEEPEREPAPRPRGPSAAELRWCLDQLGHQLAPRTAADGSVRLHCNRCSRVVAGHCAADLRALIEAGPCVPKVEEAPAQQNPEEGPPPRYSGKHVLHPSHLLRFKRGWITAAAVVFFLRADHRALRSPAQDTPQRRGALS